MMRLLLKAAGGIRSNPNNYRGIDRRLRAHWLRRPAAADIEREIARGRLALETVIASKVDVTDAMFRPDIGSISFLWGTPGKYSSTRRRLVKGSGVSKIIAQRDREGDDGHAVVRRLPDVIARGHVVEIQGRDSGAPRVLVSFEGYTAVLSLYRHGERRTWLLTGWREGDAAGVNPNRAYAPRDLGMSPQEGASDSNIGTSSVDSKKADLQKARVPRMRLVLQAQSHPHTL